MNIVVVRGRLGRDLEVRVLGDGSTVVGYELTVAREDGRTEAVPVVWPDPPSAAASAHERGADLVVVGRVRKRFFRAGGSTQSRTEVVADAVLSARQAKKVRDALAAVAAAVAP